MAERVTLPIKLIDNKAVQSNPQKYVSITVILQGVVDSYKGSLFSFEWLDQDGNVRQPKTMDDVQKSKYDSVYTAYKTEMPLERPILGIGMMENIEIGSRRDVLLTLYSVGVETMDVHIPKACLDDFKQFEC